MASTAKEELTAHWMREGLALADLDMAIAHGQRRYEEGRDGTRQRIGRTLGQVLAEMQSGAVGPMTAGDFENLVKRVVGC